MKNKISIYVLLYLTVLTSCSPKISRDYLNESKIAISDIKEVKVIDLDQNVPLKSNYIGKIKVGEAGMTIKCGYDRMINECKKEAKLVGANIVKLIRVKNPDFYSSCYRIEAKLYWNNTEEYAKGLPINIEYTERESTTLKLLQALRQGEFVFFDAEGYNITLFESSKSFNDEAIQSLKNKFEVDRDLLGKPNQNILSENVEFTTTVNQEGIETTRSTYLYRNSEGTVSVLELTTSLSRLMNFEKTIISLITQDKIPNRIFTAWEVDSIQFANRYITLGPVCRWMDIRNIQCPRLGQMDWSEFSTKERAEDYIKLRINLTETKRLSEFEDRSQVSVIFEGTPTIAEKCNLKIKAPKFVLGGSNNITIYYVVAQVEDEYIACILSHYDNDQNAPDLPPLLNEVMKLDNE